MSLTAGLFVASTIYGMYQEKKAGDAQAAAEKRNAAFFAEQARFAQRAGDRELSIFQRQTEHFISDQISRIAKSGVNFSGSYVDVVAESQYVAGLEAQAIKDQTDFNVRLAQMRGIDSLQTAQGIKEGSTARMIGVGLTGTARTIGAYESTREEPRRTRPLSEMPTYGNMTPDGGYSGNTSGLA